jgi:hypothetical protein
MDMQTGDMKFPMISTFKELKRSATPHQDVMCKAPDFLSNFGKGFQTDTLERKALPRTYSETNQLWCPQNSMDYPQHGR